MLDNYMLYVWLGVFVVALIVEGVTTELVSVWFAVGALVALPFGFFKEFWISIIVFVVVSTVALIFTRPIVRRITQRKERKTNVDDVIECLQKYENTSEMFYEVRSLDWQTLPKAEAAARTMANNFLSVFTTRSTLS